MQKALKTDIGSLFPAHRRPYKLIKAVENKKFKEALLLWMVFSKNSSFAKSPTGQAFYSYLLFKNGFELLSLKTLLNSSDPLKIHSTVGNLWKTDIDKKHFVWDRFFYRIPKKWHGFFDEETVFKLSTKDPFHLKKDQDYMKFLLSLPLSGKADLFSLEWSFILSLLKAGDLASAVKILSWLIEKTKDQNRKDMIHLAIGRLLADIEEIPAALSYYDKVKNLSYFWLLAQEEKTWLFLRQGDYSKAYATATAFNYPEFKLSPYMFFALALSQLKNCDYKGVSRSLSDFELLFSKRAGRIKKALNLDLIAGENPFRPTADHILKVEENKETSVRENPEKKQTLSRADNLYNSLIYRLTKFYNSGYRDYEVGRTDLFYSLRRDRFLKNRVLLADFIRERSSMRSTRIESLNKEEEKISRQLENQIKKRLRLLLKKEKRDIDFVLGNLHIISVEALYRIQAYHPLKISSLGAGRLNPSVLKKGSVAKSPPLLGSFISFPFDPGEIWLDELSDYKSSLPENCPKSSYIL